MSEKCFTSLLFLEFCRAAPIPCSVFKIALFPKPGLYLLKGFFFCASANHCSPEVFHCDAVLVEGC